MTSSVTTSITGKEQLGQQQSSPEWPSDQKDKLLTPDEVAHILRLDHLAQPAEAVRHLRRMGKLGYVRVGRRVRYRTEDVLTFIEKNYHAARAP